MKNVNFRILLSTFSVLFAVSVLFAQDADENHKAYMTNYRQTNAKDAMKEAQTKVRSAASIVVEGDQDPVVLISEVFIAGGCFDVENIEHNGDTRSIGKFSNGSASLGIEDGVILSTGNINNATGPNTSNARSTGFNNASNDPDLLEVVNGATDEIWDHSILEFDFTPTTDMISFEYAFASEEYCEFVGDEYNDAFGFFISGPGINGPFSNNAINIAKIPNSNSFVNINSVNHITNSTYYRPNERQINANSCNKPFEAVALNDIEYDGFTKVLTATAMVQACQTYHIRLAIGDGEDTIYDSAVFLKANSFNAGGTAVASAISPVTQSNLVYESCNDGYFVFERTSDDLEEDVVIDFMIDPNSTATQGVDYETIPTSITIPAGEMQFVLPINVLADDLVEGNETLMLEIDNACSCSVANATLTITESPLIDLTENDFELCESEVLYILPIPDGGSAGLTYAWSDGSTAPSLSSLALNDETYSVTVTDVCGTTAVAEYEVDVLAAPLANIGGIGVLCEETSEDFLAIDLEGDAPWNVTFSIDGVLQAPIEIMESPYQLAVNTGGVYALETVQTSTCSGEANGTAIVQASDMQLSYTTETATCTTNGLGSIEVSTNGTTGPYNYTWDAAFGNIANPQNIEPNTYTVTVTDALGCPQVNAISVEADLVYPEGNIATTEELTCATTTIVLAASVTTEANNTFSWSSPDGNILSGDNSLSPTVNEGGNYILEITNEDNGCVTELGTSISENITLPQGTPQAMGELTCINSETTLTVNVTGVTNIAYAWNTVNGIILSGVNTATPTVNSPGDYQVILTNLDNSCTSSSLVQVIENIEAPTVVAAEDQELTCNTPEAQLSASITSNYTTETVWLQNGEALSNSTNELNIPVSTTGEYTLVVTNQENGCSAQDQLVVIENTNYPTLMQTQGVKPACKGDVGSIRIESVQGGEAPYLFSIDGGANFFSESEFQNVQAGAYDLIVQDINGCELEKVFVLADGNEPSLALDPIVELRLGDNHMITPQLNLEAGQIDSLAWSPTIGLSCSDCLTPMVTPLENTAYTLTIVDENGCSATADIAFRVSVEKNIYIPNAFSPHNADGNNDVFQLYAQENLVAQVLTMQVFDRWGNTLYQANNFEANGREGWDGMFRSKKMKPGVYIYYFEVELINGTRLNYSGDVTLVH